MMATTKTGLRFEDKVTIVTGGSKGIGKGCVQEFVKNGANVIFCCIEECDGKEVEAEMNAIGPGEASFVACDVTKEEDIKNLINKAVEKYGRIDCVINNAGSHPPFQSIDDVTADDFRSLLNLNLVGYFLVAKYALPHLRKTQGSIINNSSLVAQIGQSGAVSYVATKGGILAMTKAMAIDESKYNVRINAISPGNVWTPMWEMSVKDEEDPEACIKTGENAQLLGRMGTTEECGQACLFLASEATFCTGIDLNLSGGAELSYGCKNMLMRKGVYE